MVSYCVVRRYALGADPVPQLLPLPVSADHLDGDVEVKDSRDGETVHSLHPENFPIPADTDKRFERVPISSFVASKVRRRGLMPVLEVRTIALSPYGFKQFVDVSTTDTQKLATVGVTLRGTVSVDILCRSLIVYRVFPVPSLDEALFQPDVGWVFGQRYRILVTVPVASDDLP